jgi:hypothetical protein
MIVRKVTGKKIVYKQISDEAFMTKTKRPPRIALELLENMKFYEEFGCTCVSRRTNGISTVYFRFWREGYRTQSAASEQSSAKMGRFCESKRLGHSLGMIELRGYPIVIVIVTVFWLNSSATPSHDLQLHWRATRC